MFTIFSVSSSTTVPPFRGPRRGGDAESACAHTEAPQMEADHDNAYCCQENINKLRISARQERV